MIKIKIALGLILFPTVLMSQGLLTNTGDPETTSLNGSWNYIVGPYEDGYFNFHAQLFEQKEPASTASFSVRGDNGSVILVAKLGEYADILSFHQYPGWKGGDLTTAPDAKWPAPCNKPVVISEFGGGAMLGLCGTKNESRTKEYRNICICKTC